MHAHRFFHLCVVALLQRTTCAVHIVLFNKIIEIYFVMGTWDTYFVAFTTNQFNFNLKFDFIPINKSRLTCVHTHRETENGRKF